MAVGLLLIAFLALFILGFLRVIGVLRPRPRLGGPRSSDQRRADDAIREFPYDSGRATRAAQDSVNRWSGT